MQLLTDKYRPSSIADFVGLDKPKAICAKLAAKPYASAWRFEGPTGVGKTTLALALAEQMPAELHHIPSQDCNLENLRRIVTHCQQYLPRAGCKMHMILVDEADQMTAAAQLYLLSKLDATSSPKDTIFIFTCNSIEGLEKRFTDRTVPVWFSSKGIAPEAAELLELVWSCEAPAQAIAPNFARIVKEANNSIRAALMELQSELMLCS